MNPPGAETESGDTLSNLSDNALKLLAGFHSTPQALRLRVGEVTLEVQWPEVAPPPIAANDQVDHGPPPAQAPRATHDPSLGRVRAPMVGVFYRAPEPGAPPFVEVGSTVKAGDQVGIIEAMKLMVPVRADLDGTVTDILKENGESVEYDEPLIAYKIDQTYRGCEV